VGGGEKKLKYDPALEVAPLFLERVVNATNQFIRKPSSCPQPAQPLGRQSNQGDK
jgi:hypothetical protein